MHSMSALVRDCRELERPARTERRLAQELSCICNVAFLILREGRIRLFSFFMKRFQDVFNDILSLNAHPCCSMGY